MNQSFPNNFHDINKLPLKQSPVPRDSHKKSIEKVILYRKTSPQRPIINQPMMQKGVATPVKIGENDLIRKNKILEQRVLELHQ